MKQPFEKVVGQHGGTVLPVCRVILGVHDAEDGDLWQAVRALPEKQRQAVAYHYVAGLAYAEIAEMLGGSTDAARRAASVASRTCGRTIKARPRKERRHEPHPRLLRIPRRP